MTSSRLPGKVLKVLANSPMLEHQINRIKRAKLIGALIVACSTDDSDDGIEAHRTFQKGVDVEDLGEAGVRQARGLDHDAVEVVPALRDQLEHLLGEEAQPAMADAGAADLLHLGEGGPAPRVRELVL